MVADFGIAKAVSTAGGDNLTRTGFAVGTPGYMSPEQAAGNAKLDARTDLFSLACVVYEMLTGDTPELLADRGRKSAWGGSWTPHRPIVSDSIGCRWPWSRH